MFANLRTIFAYNFEKKTFSSWIQFLSVYVTITESLPPQHSLPTFSLSTPLSRRERWLWTSSSSVYSERFKDTQSPGHEVARGHREGQNCGGHSESCPLCQEVQPSPYCPLFRSRFHWSVLSWWKPEPRSWEHEGYEGQLDLQQEPGRGDQSPVRSFVVGGVYPGQRARSKFSFIICNSHVLFSSTCPVFHHIRTSWF